MADAKPVTLVVGIALSGGDGDDLSHSFPVRWSNGESAEAVWKRMLPRLYLAVKTYIKSRQETPGGLRLEDLKAVDGGAEFQTAGQEDARAAAAAQGKPAPTPAPVVPPKAPAVPPKAPAVPPKAPAVPPKAPSVPPPAPPSKSPPAATKANAGAAKPATAAKPAEPPSVPPPAPQEHEREEITGEEPGVDGDGCPESELPGAEVGGQQSQVEALIAEIKDFCDVKFQGEWMVTGHFFIDRHTTEQSVKAGNVTDVKLLTEIRDELAAEWKKRQESAAKRPAGRPRKTR